MKINTNRPAPPRIEMLPLIDVVFLLLVFFIFAMLSMSVHRGQFVDLPVSNTTSVDQRKAINITIQADTSGVILFIDGKMICLEQLSDKLQQRKAAGCSEQECNIQIFADKSIAYQELFRVLDQVKSARFTRISLQAEQEENTP